MAKRTYCGHKSGEDTKRKRRKGRTLPDLEDDPLLTIPHPLDYDEYAAGNMPSSNFDGGESSSHTLPSSVFDIESSFNDSMLDENISDEDLESLESILRCPVIKENLKAGDLAWIKHSRSTCFWPAYIKSVSNKKALAFYVGYSKFTKKEKAFSYNIKSKRIKRFYTNDYNEIVEQGKKHCKESDEKKRIEDPSNGELSAFTKAIDLAESYVNHRKKGNLSKVEDIFEFFNTNGLSLCYKQCLEENKKLMYSRLPTPPLTNDSKHENTKDQSAASNQQFSCSQTQLISESNTLNIHDDASEACENKDETHSDMASLVCGAIATANRLSKQEKQNNKILALFNQRNMKIVKFILDGKCDSCLLNILQRKTPSRRMDALVSKWETGSVKRKKGHTENSYFEDSQQFETVCTHLSNFIKERAKNVTGIVECGDLLFDVFLPESIIYSIHKVQRRNLKSAEKMYTKGCQVKAIKDDPLLNRPLTDEQRSLMNYKLKDFAREMNIAL
ncbi:unnamed protein product [Clavelina lepadiformis]|uniref:PWWP domain-containing protein n=1 Tax=Clavelina lepadiformis TaxID=159417 RepID=A0ABP0FHB3_CLALP